jgi:nicotinamide-nucleotide amidase
VPQDLIARHGAVSAEVARAMAEGVRARAETDLAIATTGIAGPSGGTPDKPIGLVFIALAHPESTEVREMRYGTEPGRQGIQYLASQTALDMLRLHLLDLGEGASG